MGAWGIGNFENDDALDWLVDLEKSPDYGFSSGSTTKSRRKSCWRRRNVVAFWLPARF